MDSELRSLLQQRLVHKLATVSPCTVKHHKPIVTHPRSMVALILCTVALTTFNLGYETGGDHVRAQLQGPETIQPAMYLIDQPLPDIELIYQPADSV